MTNTEHQILDEHIRSRINELQSLLETESAGASRNDSSKKDSAQETAAAVDRQIAEKENQELVRLKSNLRWLDRDEGGCCERCRCKIPYARLRAVPQTRLCIDCAV